MTSEVAIDIMPLKTKRWNDPVEADDGQRILVCRYRPRGVRKEAENWDTWYPNLGPSRVLHADLYGKHGPAITWEVFRKRYAEEMRSQQELIGQLTRALKSGQAITLLCSSACVDEAHCHRTLLKQMIERSVSATKTVKHTGG